MKAIIIRDRTLDFVDWFLDGLLLKGTCWAIMILAALYFGARAIAAF
jgi:hypothetical protein